MLQVADDLPERNYTILNNVAVNDARLSWRARGILLYLVGRPPGWTTSVERLAQQGKEGREAVRGAIRELEALGYVVRTRARDEAGRWVHTQTVYTTPRI